MFQDRSVLESLYEYRKVFMFRIVWDCVFALLARKRMPVACQHFWFRLPIFDSSWKYLEIFCFHEFGSVADFSLWRDRNSRFATRWLLIFIFWLTSPQLIPLTSPPTTNLVGLYLPPHPPTSLPPPPAYTHPQKSTRIVTDCFYKTNTTAAKNECNRIWK